MRKIALLFVFFTLPLFALEEPFSSEFSAQTLVDLDGEPTTVVNGLVNAITGNLVETQVDAIIPGADALVLQRLYLSSDMAINPLGTAWSFNHFAELIPAKGMSDGRDNHYDWYCFLTEAGAKIRFKSCESYKMSKICRVTELKIEDKLLERGLTNTGSGTISAESNLKNYDMIYNVKDSQVQMVTGSGAIHTYSLLNKMADRLHKTSESKSNASGGLAAPLGWPIMAHGLDQLFTGLNTAISGSLRDSVTTQLLQKSGISHDAAIFANDLISIGGSLGGAAVTQGSRVAALTYTRTW